MDIGWGLSLECRGLGNEPCAGPASKLGSMGASGVCSHGLPRTDVGLCCSFSH